MSETADPWDTAREAYVAHLNDVQALSPHSVAAYRRDVNRLHQFLALDGSPLAPAAVGARQLRNFLTYLAEAGLSEPSQARVISGVKSFFKFLRETDRRPDDPATRLALPKRSKRIPEILTTAEVEQMLTAIPLDNPTGLRNRALLEVLYGCGLRVSELITLRLSNLYPDLEMIRVPGRQRERFVPFGQDAARHVDTYRTQVRAQLSVKPGHEDTLFLNRRGSGLSRVMVFVIVRNLAQAVGIRKKISPHTFRHSFAAHLLEGGADLRTIQEMLGHESVVAAETYTQLDVEYLREVIKNFHPRGQDA